LHLVL